MRKIILVLAALCVLIATSALAKDVMFTWDPNSESDLAGYRLHETGPP